MCVAGLMNRRRSARTNEREYIDIMKRRTLCALMLILLLLLPVFSANAEGKDAPVEISDAEGLAAIAKDPGRNYILTADIDMKGVDWKPIALRGTLDGGGHTIYNLSITSAGEETVTTYDGRHRGYDTVFAALFSVVKGGVVQNLNLLNVKADIVTGSPVFVAGIAGILQDGTVDNCSVKGRLKVEATGLQCGAGGIAGFGYGLITNCQVDTEITVVAVGAGRGRQDTALFVETDGLDIRAGRPREGADGEDFGFHADTL